ncbi:hypothetical protein Bbelb_183100 [Branchiostoma belcheri]|nr:hypothetical protein Bbelb_183100 [Branchiostoma belcheri]
MSNIHIINTCKALSLIPSEQGHRQHLVSLRRDRTLYKEPGFPALERERRSFAVSASSSSVSARRLFQPARRLFQQARRLFQLVVCFSSSSVSARRLFQLARRLFQLSVCFSKLVVCFSSSSVLARRLFQLVLVVCFSKLVVCFSKLVVCFSKRVVCFSKLVVCVLARRLFQQARRLFQPARCLFKQARRLFKLVVTPLAPSPSVSPRPAAGPCGTNNSGIGATSWQDHFRTPSHPHSILLPSRLSKYAASLQNERESALPNIWPQHVPGSLYQPATRQTPGPPLVIWDLFGRHPSQSPDRPEESGPDKSWTGGSVPLPSPILITSSSAAPELGHSSDSLQMHLNLAVTFLWFLW